ncbi:MAG: hypothetical protein OWT27_06135 [Firmicutes bacterium]|nr:hypothetical protein [Bacillota bacterium]
MKERDGRDIASREQAVEAALQIVLANWSAMRTSGLDDAADDAERFEQSFYAFSEELQAYVQAFSSQAGGARDERDALPSAALARWREALPDPLQLNFDLELQDIVDGWERQVDDA